MKEKTLVHWGYYFTTMSLENGRRYWDDMGLVVSTSTADEIHRLTVSTLESFFNGATLLTELSETDGKRRSVLETYLSKLAQETADIDEMESAIVSKWIACTFLGGGDYAYEDLWRSTFYDLHWKMKRNETLPVALDKNEKKFRKIVDQFFHELNFVSDDSDLLAQRPFTNLDRRIFQYYGIDSPSEIQNETSPYDIIYFTCACAKFRQIWSQLSEDGDREVMDLFYECFRRFAHDKKTDFARPELIHPPEMCSW